MRKNYGLLGDFLIESCKNPQVSQPSFCINDEFHEVPPTFFTRDEDFKIYIDSDISFPLLIQHNS